MKALQQDNRFSCKPLRLAVFKIPAYQGQLNRVDSNGGGEAAGVHAGLPVVLVNLRR
jgi:hypothetical protein